MTALRLLLSSMLLLGACATTPTMEPLDVTLSDVTPGQVSILEQQYQVKLRVQNPNNFDIDIDGASYQIELNGKAFAKGVARQSVTIPKYGDAIIEGTCVSDLSDILGQVSEFTKAGGGAPQKFSYRIKGKLGRSTGSKIPFERKGEVDLAGLTGGATGANLQ
jgi:LEA14-like dessication related protein